jgi:hypothetical protein
MSYRTSQHVWTDWKENMSRPRGPNRSHHLSETTVLERRIAQAEKSAEQTSILDELEAAMPDCERTRAEAAQNLLEWQAQHPDRFTYHPHDGPEQKITPEQAAIIEASWAASHNPRPSPEVCRNDPSTPDESRIESLRDKGLDESARTQQPEKPKFNLDAEVLANRPPLQW